MKKLNLYKHKKSSSQDGFTIIELLIASSVFGVIMLIAMTGILYIGRSYYKGIITSKTQDASRAITQEISNAFQYGGQNSVTNVKDEPAINGFDVDAVCIGNFRYSYIINSRVSGETPDKNVPTSPHGLWLDVIKEGAACKPLDLTMATPFDADTSDDTDDAKAQRRELLPNNMRLDRFNVSANSASTNMKVDLNIIYGEHDLSPGGICIANRQGGQFCARSALSTTVKKRL